MIPNGPYGRDEHAIFANFLGDGVPNQCNSNRVIFIPKRKIRSNCRRKVAFKTVKHMTTETIRIIFPMS